MFSGVCEARTGGKVDGLGNEELVEGGDERPPSNEIQSQQVALCGASLDKSSHRHSVGHRALQLVRGLYGGGYDGLAYPPTFRHPCGGVIFALPFPDGVDSET